VRRARAGNAAAIATDYSPVSASGRNARMEADFFAELRGVNPPELMNQMGISFTENVRWEFD